MTSKGVGTLSLSQPEPSPLSAGVLLPARPPALTLPVSVLFFIPFSGSPILRARRFSLPLGGLRQSPSLRKGPFFPRQPPFLLSSISYIAFTLIAVESSSSSSSSSSSFLLLLLVHPLPKGGPFRNKPTALNAAYSLYLITYHCILLVVIKLLYLCAAGNAQRSERQDKASTDH
jgi:hypothetical protein